MDYKEFFSSLAGGKKITMMGLGILGRGLNIAKFLAECGAELTITDLKTAKQLAPSLKILTPYKNIKYVLGKHDLADFRGKDMVIKAAGVPLDSPYIAEARKNNISVEMDASLFLKLLTTWTSNVQVVGITGTRGKSTVTHLIYDIIKNSGKRVHLGGNVKGLATLPLLKKVRPNDVVVMELDSWQLQGFGDAKISPNVSVFTTFLPDHLNYYNGDMDRYFSDKANIYRWQNGENCLIAGNKTAKLINGKEKNGIKSQLLIADGKKIPRNWKVKLLGEHNLANIALAIEAARKLSVKESVIKKSVENFKGLPGRLEFIREVKRIKFYNDTTATTPEAVIAAMESLKEKKGRIILIGGGADKNLEYGDYAKVVKKTVKAMALFRGMASNKIISSLGKTKFPVEIFDNMKSAIKFAVSNTKKGDIVLLSPGAASFGVFKNEFDRGEQFNKAVKKLK
jgi:UDP-N-acetylmuramoylalanine--D-glutamate ligase